MGNINSSTYLRSKFTKLLNEKKVIIHDDDSPAFRKYAKREYEGIELNYEPHKTEYSKRRRRKIVREWVYYI